MPDVLSNYDAWINEGGPSALVLKEYLQPAAGPDEVIFPPTFAPPEEKRKDPSSYIIDGEGENTVCLLDSVGSQANRLEALFKQEKYRALVPQISVNVEGRIVNLLDLGHRAADALIRSTKLAADLQKAFLECDAGNAVSLAKVAPTSLVFGAWDSRSSQVKLPRLVDSTIRAFRVVELSRAAQYFSALTNDEVDTLLLADAEKQKKPLSKAGFLDAPSGRTCGGVIVRGDIVRTTIVNLTALRYLGAPSDEDCRNLRRYIFSLCLLVVFAPVDLFLRQGCLLVRTSKPLERRLIYRDGRTEDWNVEFDAIESFARVAAEGFKVGENQVVSFDVKAAKDMVKQAGKAKEDA